MKKLNLGCGADYREGFVNVDFNKHIKADIYCDLEKKLPFETNSIDYILIDNTLEHIKDFFGIIKEMHRICKKGAVIEVYVPHYSGMYAFYHITHYNFFGINTFDLFEPYEKFNGERYIDETFKTITKRLLFFHHNLVNTKFLSSLPINWLFNFGQLWQMLMERFNPFGFDEVYFKLEVIK